MVDAYDTETQATGLIRVLKLDGSPCGEWDPKLAVKTLKEGLRHMMLTRAVDERMFAMQRQGKMSFYMKSAGEEAVAVAAAMALNKTDMVFPTYRQTRHSYGTRLAALKSLCANVFPMRVINSKEGLFPYCILFGN